MGIRLQGLFFVIIALVGARQVHKFDQDADETLNCLQEKEALLVTESIDDLGQTDLPTIQAKLQRHDVFMRELTAAEKQVENLSRVAERLIGQYPNTRDHLDVLRQDMGEVLKDVLSASKQKYDRLKQAEQLQTGYDIYRDSMGWINEMHATMTSKTLPRTIASVEALLIRHKKYHSEIDARAPSIDEFVKAGKDMVQRKHLLSQVVQEKIDHLENSFMNLSTIWNELQAFYEINMDALERRQEHERRRTQEIQLYKPQVENGAGSPMVLCKTSEGLTMTPAGSIDVDQRPAKVEKRDSASSRGSIGKPPIPPKPAKIPDSFAPTRPRSLSSEGHNAISVTLTAPTSSSEASGTATLSTPWSADIRKVQRFRQGANIETTPRLTPKRTPSFTTRRQHSLKRVRGWDDMQQIEKEGYITRKQYLQSGGKKATIRSWKKYYTVLCGQLMCSFKDEEAFQENMAAAPPVYVLHAQCAPCPEYHKRKYTFRLKTQDSAEYFFAGSGNNSIDDWVKKIPFDTALPPSMQLKAFEDRPLVTQVSFSASSSPAALRPYDHPPPPLIPPFPGARSTSADERRLVSPETVSNASLSPPLPARHSSLYTPGLRVNGDHQDVIRHRPDGLDDKDFFIMVFLYAHVLRRTWSSLSLPLMCWLITCSKCICAAPITINETVARLFHVEAQISTETASTGKYGFLYWLVPTIGILVIILLAVVILGAMGYRITTVKPRVEIVLSDKLDEDHMSDIMNALKQWLGGTNVELVWIVRDIPLDAICISVDDLIIFDSAFDGALNHHSVERMGVIADKLAYYVNFQRNQWLPYRLARSSG